MINFKLENLIPVATLTTKEARLPEMYCWILLRGNEASEVRESLEGMFKADSLLQSTEYYRFLTKNLRTHKPITSAGFYICRTKYHKLIGFRILASGEVHIGEVLRKSDDQLWPSNPRSHVTLI